MKPNASFTMTKEDAPAFLKLLLRSRQGTPNNADPAELVCTEHGWELTDEQVTASRFLESRGLRFMCEFGTANAVELADALFKKECEEAKRP